MTESLPPLTPLIAISLGLALLLLGRRLFWIFVGVVGFFAGLHFGAHLAAGQTQFVILLIAIACALAGVLLAILLQRVAVAIAGGLAGGMLAMRVVLALGMTGHETQGIAFIVGAILAAIMISLLFDWALIVFSSLTGAIMISEQLPLSPSFHLAVTALLALVGFAAQTALFLRQRTIASPAR